MGCLDGKVALVTGAGRGLGRAEALALAAEGAAVVVNDPGFRLGGEGVDGDVARKVVAEIEAGGGRAVPHFGDCATWSEAKDMIGTALAAFGGFDVLVNNAGNLRDRMSFNLSEADFDAVVRVHLKGHFATCHHAGAYWRERHKAGRPVRARIVNTTSESGLHGNTGQINYTVAKAGIAALTITLARELARYGVTVNAVSPRGTTRLSTFDETGEDAAEPDALSGGERMDPRHVGTVVAWLASERAEFTGQVIWAMGDGIALYKPWRRVAERGRDLAREGPWTVDALASAAQALFAGQLRGPEPLPFESEGQREAAARAARGE